jgi:hypothetical protein
MGLTRAALRRAFGLALALAGAALRLAIGVPRAAFSAIRILADAARSRRRLKGGVFHCPEGHEVETEGQTYRCDACGFTYGGHAASIWLCGNPACGAVTPWVDCPTCGLSCRNPYRWG